MNNNDRRKFLKILSLAGMGALGHRAMAQQQPPIIRSPRIKWKLQTYADNELAQYVIRPSIEAFNFIAGNIMQIELLYSGGPDSFDDSYVHKALMKGELNAAQYDDRATGIDSLVDVAIFSGYFPFAVRYPMDIPALFNGWGLNDIWREAYNSIDGITWLSAGAWDPCHLSTVASRPVNTLEDLRNLKVFTSATASDFLKRLGVKSNSTLPFANVKPALDTGAIHGIAWSGITESYSLGWVDFAPNFLANHITGAWLGSYFVNSKSWNALPSRMQELFRFCVESSHYSRLHWYWKSEAHIRVKQKKHTQTTISNYEWQEIKDEAYSYWNEVAKMSSRNSKVIKILREYNEVINAAGYPYSDVYWTSSEQ